jgi:DNA-binding NarL/FixJ family response regulator
MAAIRILIVDDHTLFRRGLVGLLQDEPQCQVVGQASNGEEALRMVQELPVDVVLMDIKMPGVDGIEVSQRILEVRPSARVIVLSVSEDDQDVLGAVLAGARGYLLKNADADELVLTIRRVHAGEAVLSPVVTLRVLEALRGRTSLNTLAAQLTSREYEVMELLAKGFDNQRISTTLAISGNTVKTHVAHILEKLKLRSRSQVAAYAGLTGWHSLGKRKP